MFFAIFSHIGTRGGSTTTALVIHARERSRVETTSSRDNYYTLEWIPPACSIHGAYDGDLRRQDECGRLINYSFDLLLSISSQRLDVLSVENCNGMRRSFSLSATLNLREAVPSYLNEREGFLFHLSVQQILPFQPRWSQRR